MEYSAPGIRSFLDGAADLRLSLEADTSEERGLLSKHASSIQAAKDGQRLLKGFYAYSIASEVFAIVGLTLFLPVALEQMAREHGSLTPDYSVPCPPSSTIAPGDEEMRCAVRLLGCWVDTAAFSLFVYSSSVALQALTVISIGRLADNPHTRHRLLTTFAAAGSLFTISFLLLPSTSSLWPLSAFLAIGANVSFGASIVCLNSYLPELGRGQKEVLVRWDEMDEAYEELRAVKSTAERTGEALLGATQKFAKAKDEYVRERSLATSHVSSTAVAAGFGAGILVLTVLIVPVTLMHGSTLSLRLAIASSGVWWGGGTIPAAIWLRPSQALDSIPPSAKLSVSESLIEGWRGLARMLREYRRLPSTFVFLSTWFLLSDSFSTLTSTAIIFGKTSLGMQTSSLMLVAILTPTSGIAGAILFPRLQKEVLHWPNLKVLILLVALALLVPLWGIVALRAQWEMYFLAVVFGAIYGSFQAYARSCFSELVPSSQAAQWFGLYSITDKSSSFLGPLLVALITNLTGQIRYGFGLIGVMLVVSLPILSWVDMEQGRNDAEKYQRETVVENLEEGE